MELQTKKLKAIESLIGVNDESVLSLIEQTNKHSLVIENKFSHKSLDSTKKQLLNRAKLAQEDIENNRFISQDELEELSANW
jgi:hypothetical protein